VCRYVERNALRAGLVGRAEDWRWCSLWRRLHADADPPIRLGNWPMARADNWVEWVNMAQTVAEEQAIQRCARKGQPFGTEKWVQDTVQRLGQEITMRRPGRPRKARAAGPWLPFAENGS